MSGPLAGGPLGVRWRGPARLLWHDERWWRYAAPIAEWDGTRNERTTPEARSRYERIERGASVSAPITTILLDLDDTILYDDYATELAFAATAAHAQAVAGVDPARLVPAVIAEAGRIWMQGPFPDWLHDIGTSELEGLRSCFAGDDPHWAEMRIWGPGFRRETWRAALAACGIEYDELADDLNTRFHAERAATNPFIPGAEAALDVLSNRYRLGLVTNGIPDVQREKLVRTDLTDRFGAVIVSGELGIGKPDPRVYGEALRQLGATPETTLMVGDSFARDVAGAQAIGIRAAWIAAGRRRPEGLVKPFLTVDTLAELPARLSERPDARPVAAG